MIEISNEELAKVLNLWTETEDWIIQRGKLFWVDWVQRDVDGKVYDPEDYVLDKAAHDLVNFMLKERKYPGDKIQDVFYPSYGDSSHETYIAWVKKWEEIFGDKPQDDQPKDIDHSIPVRYDHLISTEELVKRAQKRWPDDGWSIEEGEICSKRYSFSEPGCGIILHSVHKGRDSYSGLRSKLLTLISEADETVERPVCQDIPTDPQSKAERFYAFLATPQLDISPGLWGIATMVGAPVRGGDNLGWARKNVCSMTYAGVGVYTRSDEKGMTRNGKALVTVEV